MTEPKNSSKSSSISEMIPSGYFNGRPLESMTKKELIDVIVWLNGESVKQIDMLEENMKYIYNVSKMALEKTLGN